MNFELAGFVAIFITQVAATAYIKGVLSQIVKRLDRLNGSIVKLEDWRLSHLKEFHSEKK